VDPDQLDARAQDQVGLLVFRAGHLDEDPRRRSFGKPGQRRTDRRERALVADQQVPVGLRAGRVATTGPEHLDPVAGCRGGRPRPGQPLVPVVHEVDRELTGGRVPGPHGVGARDRPLLLRQLRAHLLDIEGHLVGRAGRREQQLHVVVGELAGREAGQALAAQHHPDHVRTDPGAAQDLADAWDPWAP